MGETDALLATQHISHSHGSNSNLNDGTQQNWQGQEDPVLAPLLNGEISAAPPPKDAPISSNEAHSLGAVKTNLMVGVLFMGTFLAAMDMTVVTTLLPNIASDLEASSQMSWIATSYLLSCSSFQPMYGKLSNVLGRREMLVAANLFFAVGCLLCGSSFSSNVWYLSIARFIAGIGGGGMNTLSTIAISDLIPLRQRGMYQGLGNICYSLGSASGSVLGALLQKSVGWRWAFLIQVPIAALSAALVFITLKLPDESPGRGSVWIAIKENGHFDWSQIPHLIDLVGCISLVSAMLVLMVTITFLNDPGQLGLYEWAALLLVLALTFGYFVHTELNVENPVIPLKLVVGNRTILSSSLTNWFCTMAMFAAMYFMPIFWQAAYGLTPWDVGLRSISNFLGISIGSLGSGLYIKATGKYRTYSLVIYSLFVLGILTLFLTTFHRDSLGYMEYFLMFLPGVGYATMLTVTLLALIASVDYSHQAQVTSIQYAFRATGSTFGVALAGLVYQTGLKYKLKTAVLGSSELLSKYGVHKLEKWCQEIITDNLFDTSFDKTLQYKTTGSFMFGSQGAIGFALVMAILGLISSMFTREHFLHTSVPSRT
ncbi:LAFA_0A03554g1_1 [Lachancea sp. 'fantastica']|nr:LAFA_0A03554g1_1 [Lachancea sp. 'fantastica']